MRTLLSPEIRFWSLVNRQGPVHPVHGRCWLWIGGVSSSGYGTFWDGQKTVGTHKFSYTISNGVVEEGEYVLHKCDNKRCVRPEHLFLGSNKDNSDDMMKKGRKKTSATESMVFEIRRRARLKKKWQKDPVNGPKALSEEFGLPLTVVKDIIRGVTWKHLL